MDKGKLNVIIFDEEEDSPSHPRPDPSPRPAPAASPAPQYDIVEQEIHYLAEKVRQLELQSEQLTLFRNDSQCSQRPSLAPNDPAAHTRDVLLAIEKKIQVVVRETKRIVDRMGEAFEKKLEARLGRRQEELGVGKAKEHYLGAVRQAEEHYRREAEKSSREFKEAEGRMLARVGEAEQRFMAKMNEFAIKEKEYVAWIHHLEAQLKEREQRSRKMIEVTQERAPSRKEQSETNSLLSQPDPNYSSLHPQRVSPLPHDTSKAQRKHRIFDSKGALSPHKPQPALLASKVVNPALRAKPLEEEQPVTVSLATRTGEGKGAVESESSPWRLIDKSTDKREGTGRNRVIENVREEEFLRDVPKASSGWDKFQDFREEEESSESEEDVLFYREGEGERVFSPFDLS